MNISLWRHRGSFLRVICGAALLCILLSACSGPFAGSPSPSATSVGNTIATQVTAFGVTPIAHNGSRTVSDKPAAVASVINGKPLPGDLVKTLTFQLVYNDAALEQAIAQMYTPGSATYQRYLSPAEIVQRYAESDAQVQTVSDWLTSHGYTQLRVDALRSSISVQASVSAINQSLGIHLETFTALGRAFFMPDVQATLSGEVAGLVQSVGGLDNLALPIIRPPNAALKSAQGANAGACDKYGAHMSLTRDRLASAYQMNTFYQQGHQGQGMTIGVAEFDEPYDLNDLRVYAGCAGVQVPQVQNIQVDYPTPSGPGEGEAALDLELILGLVPKATILDYQVGMNNGAISFAQALVDVFTKVAVDRKVQVLSVSYGAGDGTFTLGEQDAVNRALRTLAAEGISVFISSGDCGAYSERVQNIAMVSFPASAPYAIAVGGTHLQVTASGARASEDVWGDQDGSPVCQNEWGSGGGVSQNPHFRRPSWQVGSGTTSQYDGTSQFVLTANLSPVQAPNGLRQVPDVAAAAYPNISIYYQGTWYNFGGTSAASPIWAAGALLVDEALKSQNKGLLGGVPAFYTLANRAGSGHPYVDITRGTNLFYPATRGWDYTTGWGSPNLSQILEEQISL